MLAVEEGFMGDGGAVRGDDEKEEWRKRFPSPSTKHAQDADITHFEIR